MPGQGPLHHHYQEEKTRSRLGLFIIVTDWADDDDDDDSAVQCSAVVSVSVCQCLLFITGCDGSPRPTVPPEPPAGKCTGDTQPSPRKIWPGTQPP